MNQIQRKYYAEYAADLAEAGKLNDKFRRKLKRMFKKDNGRRLDPLEIKVLVVGRISLRSEAGKIAVVSGGMDCDCVRWDGAVEIIPATYTHLMAWENDFYEAAEGPQHYKVERPSVARDIERTERDLAMEAHENGHPHTVYY